MTEMKLGTTTINYPDHIKLPAEAGTMSPADLRNLPKARRGVGATAEAVAQAMVKHPDKFQVRGVNVDELMSLGRQADDLDGVVADLETALMTLKQANTIVDSKTHDELRKVLAYVRSTEKFEPAIAELVPQLIQYFSNERAKGEPTGTPST